MDKIKLEYEMKKKGFTTATFCKAVGMSRTSFYRKNNGLSEYTMKEIQTIIDVLELETPMGIFFTDKVS